MRTIGLIFLSNTGTKKEKRKKKYHKCKRLNTGLIQLNDYTTVSPVTRQKFTRPSDGKQPVLKQLCGHVVSGGEKTKYRIIRESNFRATSTLSDLDLYYNKEI